MLWFDAEIERAITDAELQLAASRLVGCTRDQVLIINEDYPPLDSPPVCISVRANQSGQFALLISVYLFAPFREVVDRLTLLEAGSLLAIDLHMRVLMPNDDTSDPYSFVVVESNGEGAIVAVDSEQLDLHNAIEIRRVGRFGRVSRLGCADIVSLLLREGICRPEEIVGLPSSIIALQEQRIAAELPWQYREFLLAVGAGAGRFLRVEGALYNEPQQTAAQLRSLTAEYPDLDSLVDALIAGNGVYPLSVGPVVFRYFKLGLSANPVVYEWNHQLPWPVPTWACLTAFLTASISDYAN
jgi:hypothetical protein